MSPMPIISRQQLVNAEFSLFFEACQQLRYVKTGIIVDPIPEISTEWQLHIPDLHADQAP